MLPPPPARRPSAVLPLLTALAALLLGGCEAGSEGPPASDNARPPASLRIVQPRPHARIPLWEEARQLGKVKVLFDVGSTPLARGEGEGLSLLTRIDDRPATRVHDVHAPLIRKPRVGEHVLHAWIEDASGRRLAEASVPFRVLP